MTQSRGRGANRGGGGFQPARSQALKETLMFEVDYDLKQASKQFQEVPSKVAETVVRRK